MKNEIKNSKRVAKNTLYLYFRTLFVMGVTFFTSRLILDVLGVEDYGIYNVVGGFVMMFSVLSGTLSAASQRFIAFELGKKEPEVTKVFSTTITIHLLLALVIFLLLETFGLWFLNCKMNISSERIYAANWVFQCSVLTFCVNLISIPYNAAIIAFEKMSAFAYISIFEVLFKLGAVYALYIIKYDSLIIYALFMLVVAITLRAVYSWYCHSKFSDCRFKLKFDKGLFSEMIGFSGWNFIGSTAGVLNNQGINILVNLFFGVALNASRGIATQVDHAINTFVQNFMMALNPQLTKSYAAGDYAYVNTLINKGTKYAFFLFWILCLPILLNTDYILSIWLKKVPDYSSLFVKLAIIFTLCQTLSQCLYITMLATGNIKKYQIVVGSLSILAFPVTYLLFKIGLSAEYGYYSMIFFSLVCLLARLYLLKGMVNEFSIRAFISSVIFKCLLVVIPSFFLSYLIHYLINSHCILTLIGESAFIVLATILLVYVIGLNRLERSQILELASKRITRNKQ